MHPAAWHEFLAPAVPHYKRFAGVAVAAACSAFWALAFFWRVVFPAFTFCHSARFCPSGHVQEALATPRADVDLPVNASHRITHSLLPMTRAHTRVGVGIAKLSGEATCLSEVETERAAGILPPNTPRDSGGCKSPLTPMGVGDRLPLTPQRGFRE